MRILNKNESDGSLTNDPEFCVVCNTPGILALINCSEDGDESQNHMLDPNSIKGSIVLSVLALPFRPIRIPPKA